ncbi:ParB/RepB/Spo0J family partition protein [Mangrovicoccus algicola]|uniref:ParB/RepB/Spo0J family partition protein n=1 Tax=Mangrovicoccus algicola TaxID=2771008 RepID=A0A8J7CWX0_9RHOB|nr:ParB/RepB/Spo0J family partition protein [Mangrovicoccus algicola]MBE3638277.1 ParB/RepB/Spo0J family partition protein [Mangrovicoccus algicola]
MEKRGLGRGLSALMADVALQEPSRSEAGRSAELTVPVETVAPNPDQPRRHFREEDLADLAASIAEKGVLQPLIVRPNPGGSPKYQIVAGERRWRAAQRAQVHSIPVIVRNYSDTEMLEIAIIENVQRADLNAVEEALGYRQLMDKFGHTQERLAEALGKSRSYIANLLRLLQLPDEVLALLRDGLLSAGHARALITSENPAELAKVVVDKGLSVRDTERLAKASAEPPAPRPARPEKDADTRVLEQDLSNTLGMRVSVDHKSNGSNGQLVIKYKSLDQLDTLCRLLSVS